MGIAARHTKNFEKFYELVSSDIFAYADAAGFDPTWQQKDFFNLVQRGEPRIAVKSGQGPGKTASSCIAGGYRTLQHKDAMTIVTAPTMRQCRVVWLQEFRRVHEKAHPFIKKLIEVTMSRVIYFGRTQWGIFTVTATKPEAAQGLHDPNLTIIAEEASGLPRALIEQYEGTSTNPNSMFIQIGNPNTRECAFFDCFHSMRAYWKCLTFNAEDTARDYPHIITPEQHKYLAAKYGRNSDVYRVRVLGEFPNVDPRCVIALEWCEEAAKRGMTPASTQKTERGGKMVVVKQIGIDFARFGSDESVIAVRLGNAIIRLEHFEHVEPDQVVARAFAIQASYGWTDAETWYVPDAGGMGQGVLSLFKRAQKNFIEFHSQGMSSDASYENKITEAFFSVRDLLKDGTPRLPNDSILFQQLSTRQYYLTKKGKIEVETKDEYIRRGDYSSPDRADAVVMAFYDRVIATGQVSGRNNEQRKTVLKEGIATKRVIEGQWRREP